MVRVKLLSPDFSEQSIFSNPRMRMLRIDRKDTVEVSSRGLGCMSAMSESQEYEVSITTQHRYLSSNTRVSGDRA